MKTVILLLAAVLVCAVSVDAAPGNGNGNGNAGNGNGNSNAGNGNGNSNAGGNGNGQASDTAAGNADPNTDANAASNSNAGGNGQPGSTAQGNGDPQPASVPPGQAAQPESQSQGNGQSDVAPRDAAQPGPGQPAGHGNAPVHAASSGGAGSADAGGQASTVADPPAPLAPAALPQLADASSALHVQRGTSGNHLAWGLPTTAAAQVQVWRLDPEGWVPVAVTTSEGQAFDSAGLQHSEYRLTWSDQPLGAGALASVASSFSFAPAVRDADSGIGAFLLGLLWASAAVFGTVRTNVGPRRVNEGRVADDNQLLPLLAGVPGVDVAALDRVVSLGLRTVGQLRRLDANAVAFWTGLPAATVRTWQQTIDLMQWPSLPPGAAQRLALAGHATLAQVAAARPAELMASLHRGVAVVGPGLPNDEQEVANWVVEARQALGLSVESVSTPVSAASTTA